MTHANVNAVEVIVAVCVLGFWAYCLFDLTRADEREIRTFDKPVWVILLVFTSIFGGLMWLVYGRPQRR